MKTTNLRSGKIITLTDKISEIVIDQGVEMNDDLVEEMHDYFVGHKQETTGLLVNKKNEYAYTFSAQAKIGDLPHIKAIAIICYRQSSRITSELIAKLPRKHPWNFKIFDNYEDGLEWLKSEIG